jgi:hypothetical protein
MTTTTDAIVLTPRGRRRTDERAGFVMLPRVWGRCAGTDMTPGAWMILRMELDLARWHDGDLMHRGYSLPSRFVRVRFTCEPHGQDARSDRKQAS